jgi:8-oxo-dGTP pyrophosphatase MutT (NUDIX family)
VTLHDDAVLVLKAYEDQPELRQAYLDHLSAHPEDGMWKACTDGHLTASALVIDPSRGRVLLTLHKKLQMWLQMGGHCEPGDLTLADAALREATEESGIPGLTLLPGPCTRHLDTQYAAVAPADAVAAISDESLDLRWFPYDEVADVADDSVVRLVEATRARL